MNNLKMILLKLDDQNGKKNNREYFYGDMGHWVDIFMGLLPIYAW